MARWFNSAPPIEARIARASALYQARLARVPLMAHPGFRYKVNQEGYSDFTFGGRVGPSIEFSALCHDLAHAVEFGPESFEDRCTPWGKFVLNVREVEIMGNLYPDPQTGQATERECRVFGIETRLYDLFGVRYDLDAFCRSAHRLCGFLPDWIHYDKKPEAIAVMVRQGRDLFTSKELLLRLEGWFESTHKKSPFLQPKARSKGDQIGSLIDN